MIRESWLESEWKQDLTIPSFLRQGSTEQVPTLFNMRASFFETAQDIASQILTYADDKETVTRLANELYAEATKRLKP